MPHANSWSSIGRSVGSVLTPARTLAIVCTLGPTVFGTTLYWRNLATKEYVTAQLNIAEHGFEEPLPEDPRTGQTPSAPTILELSAALTDERAENAKLRKQIAELRVELIEEAGARVSYVAADYERDPNQRAATADRARGEFLESVRGARECPADRPSDQPCTPIADAARHALEPKPQAFRRGR